MPKNAKPIFVLITDEMPYDYVSREMAAAVHVNLAQQISTAEIFEELKAKYAVYIILKPYGEYGDPAITARVRKTWLELVDEGHIANMEEPERVVDIIFGILAMEADRNDYFEKELRGRQTKAQVTTVMRSLKTIHARSAKAENGTKRRPAGAAGKSTLFRVGSGKKVDDLD